MLYHTLTGRPPYTAASSAEVVKRVLAGPPKAVTDRAPGTPRDLAAIVAKAMARDPDDRYFDAEELADDLRRHQEGQLVAAHHYTRGQLVGRWLRRHRVIVGAAVVAIAAAVVAFVGISLQLGAARRAEQKAVEAGELVEAQRAAAVKRTNELILTQAEALLDTDPTMAIAWLKHYPLNAPKWKRVALTASRAKARGVIKRRLRGSHGRGTLIASRHGHVIVNEHGQMRVWNSGGRVLLQSKTTWLGPSAISTDGATIVWAAAPNQLAIRKNGEKTRQQLVGKLLSLALNKDATHLALGFRDGRLVEMTLATKSTKLLARHAGPVQVVDYHPTNTHVASVGSDKVIRIIGGTDRTELASLKTDGLPLAVAFHPEDGVLGVVESGGRGTLWNYMANRVEVIRKGSRSFDDPELVLSDYKADLKFSRNGRALALVHSDVSVFGVAGSQVKHRFSRPGVVADFIGNLIAVGNWDSSLKVFNDSGALVQELQSDSGLEPAPMQLASVSSTEVAVRGFATTEVWSVPPPPVAFFEFDNQVGNALFSADKRSFRNGRARSIVALARGRSEIFQIRRRDSWRLGARGRR